MITLFHGTDKANLPAIKSSGLLPQGSPGCDQDWKFKERWANRSPAVYLVRDPRDAAIFARYACALRGDPETDGVVLTVQLPDSEAHKLAQDEAAGDDIDAYRLEQGVPAGCIVGERKATEFSLPNWFFTSDFA